MKPHTMLVTVAVVVVLAGCSSFDVSNDWNREVDFSAFKTFTWLERTGEEPGDQLPSHLDIRLRRVVDDVLTEKGFRRTSVPPEADLLLTYYVSFEKELRVDTYGGFGAYGYGYWPGYYGVGTTSVRVVANGTIVVDVVDRRTKQLVWTGQIQGVVQNRNPPGDRVEMVAEKLLRAFPPGPTS
jgi:hypothetical protein